MVPPPAAAAARPSSSLTAQLSASLTHLLLVYVIYMHLLDADLLTLLMRVLQLLFLHKLKPPPPLKKRWLCAGIVVGNLPIILVHWMHPRPARPLLLCLVGEDTGSLGIFAMTVVDCIIITIELLLVYAKTGALYVTHANVV
eukprot:gnl/Hemi2/17799_TR5871_c0_g2_i1.p1 gnl/Hemi2/17799_TR5871_c0_g2~~gnl/Hemi2/17799_TR5871_c0_g2_i1.p1  ORF type:complete len:142 (-),score=46.05 gnl/Hemi2/17799_TR5871_c0_g2_i1:140-565(-)